MEFDCKLYLLRNNQGVEADWELFLKWEEKTQSRPANPDSSSERIMRGLKLRPDRESLNLLLLSSDVTWMADPQIVYMEDWLGQVPDDLAAATLKSVGGKMDNSSAGLRILLLLRVRAYP